MKTFWLYYNSELIDAVRLHDDATNEEVRAKALDNFRKAPMYPDTCNGKERKIYFANIVRE